MGRSEYSYSLMLVNPVRHKRFQWDMREICELMGKRTTAVPLALPLIAALTPAKYEVQIVDEEIEPLALDGLAHDRYLPDIVGITSLYSNVARGFDIADAFRARGIPVVMGGPEVSFNVEYALQHCDAVVIGEAEGVWQLVLDDFEKGALKSTYQAASPCDFQTSPKPRWDLLDMSRVMTTVVQVSRGCPNRCRFCVVSKMFGKEQRYRKVDDVIAEIQAAPVKEIAFADDNLLANREFARELMEKMIPLGVSWSCQSSLEIGLEPDMVELMAESGCRTVLFGFESINSASILEAEKSHNVVSRYEEIIKNVHRAGIHVLASFLVGFDADTLETFEQIHEFVRRNKLTFVMVNSLSPFRGTALYRSLERQGRLIPMDTNQLVLFYPMMRYRNMSPLDVCDHGLKLLRNIYSFRELREKGPAVLGNGAFVHSEGKRLTFSAKMISSFNLLQTYLFTRHPEKRRLFLDLFQLVKAKRATADDVVRYLLFAESQNGFLDYAEVHMTLAKEHIRDKLRNVSGFATPKPDENYRLGSASIRHCH